MKIVVFGDVHGNLVALEKLFQIEASETDLFVSHGDVVNYGPWSNECVSFLKDRSNCELLKGNHENYFSTGNYDGTNEVAKSFFDFCYLNFDKNLVPEIQSYKNELLIPDYTIRHTIQNRYIFENSNIDDFTIFNNFIIGHSHQQYGLMKDGYEIYNTGSIGQNRSLLDLSCYLKVDTDKKTVDLKSFSHDIDKVINQMESDNYPKICLDYYKEKKRFETNDKKRI